MSVNSYPAGHLLGAASESTKKNTGPVVNRRCPGLGTPDRRVSLWQAIGTTDDGAAEGHRSAAGAQVQLFLRTGGEGGGLGTGTGRCPPFTRDVTTPGSGGAGWEAAGWDPIRPPPFLQGFSLKNKEKIGAEEKGSKNIS